MLASQYLLIFWPISFSHLNGSEVNYDLGLYFTDDVEHLFLNQFLSVLKCSLEKHLFRLFTISILGCFIYYWTVIFAGVFWRQLPYQIYDLQIFYASV